MELEDSLWMCTYNYKTYMYVVSRIHRKIDQEGAWSFLKLDLILSDSGRDFQVYCDDRNSVTQVIIKADKYGTPKRVHRQFDLRLLGSPTLWMNHYEQPDGPDGFVWYSGGASPWLEGVVPESGDFIEM